MSKPTHDQWFHKVIAEDGTPLAFCADKDDALLLVERHPGARLAAVAAEVMPAADATLEATIRRIVQDELKRQQRDAYRVTERREYHTQAPTNRRPTWGVGDLRLNIDDLSQ